MFEEDADYEFNARYDDRRERYGDPCPSCGNLRYGGDCGNCLEFEEPFDTLEEKEGEV